MIIEKQGIGKIGEVVFDFNNPPFEHKEHSYIYFDGSRIILLSLTKIVDVICKHCGNHVGYKIQ